MSVNIIARISVVRPILRHYPTAKNLIFEIQESKKIKNPGSACGPKGETPERLPSILIKISEAG